MLQLQKLDSSQECGQKYYFLKGNFLFLVHINQNRKLG